MRIELTYPVWKTDVLTVELHPQVASFFSESGKILMLNEKRKKDKKITTSFWRELNPKITFQKHLMMD